MGRTLAAAALGFAAGVAVGRLLGSRTGGAVAPAGRPPDEPAAAGAAAPAHEAPKRPRHPDVDTDERRETAEPRPAGPPVAVTSDVREIPLDGAPSGWTELGVELVDGDGRPVPGACIRASAARPAGSALDYNEVDDEGPQCDTDAAGRGVLRVGSPARYELSVTRGLWSLWAFVAAEPGAQRVRMVEPAQGELEVATAEPIAEGERVKLRLRPVAGQTAAGPERTIASSSSTTIYEDFELSAREPSRSLRLLGSFMWRIDGRDGTVVEPVVTQVPTLVRVKRAEGGRLNVHARLVPARSDRYVDVRYVLPGGVAEESGSVGPDESTQAFDVVTRAGTVRWHGADVEDGAVAYDLAASGDVDAVVRPRAGSVAGDAVVRLEITQGADVPETGIEGALYSATRTWDGNEPSFAVGADTTLARAADFWAIVPPPKRESEPYDQRVGGPVLLRAGQRHVLTFGTGGFVVVAPRGTPPAGGGEVEIVRADGGPLVLPDSSVEERVRAAAGTVLGPFAPGAVTLDVRVGGVPWARYEVTIRAGEHTALPIGPFGGRR